jgi:hypothetical protein
MTPRPGCTCTYSPAGPDRVQVALCDRCHIAERAKAAILRRGRASAVVLQRELGVGYRRAVEVLDGLTAAGELGPDTPSGQREIRFT